jgi:Cu-Zn family superoxide dismutase
MLVTKNIIYALFGVALFMTACKNDKKTQDVEVEESVTVDQQESAPEVKRVEMILESRSGSKATGKVVFIEDNGIVKMTAKLVGLDPGTHAIHIHEKADCSSEDGTSTGGHWNPTFEPHGKWGDEKGFHRGDIGNMVADENGEASISLKTDLWCLGCDDEQKNILGKAIIVHQGTDDFVSQPSGAAGARISCGGIIK